MEKVGITFGSWDLLHPGHVQFLMTCMENCDKLLVGLQTRPYGRADKNQPIETSFERWSRLDGLLREHDVIFPYDTEEDIENIMGMWGIDVRFLGSDYKGVAYTAPKDNVDVMYIERDHNYSSSNLRERILKAESVKNQAQIYFPPNRISMD